LWFWKNSKKILYHNAELGQRAYSRIQVHGAV
jgi:hypothetical protein